MIIVATPKDRDEWMWVTEIINQIMVKEDMEKEDHEYGQPISFDEDDEEDEDEEDEPDTIPFEKELVDLAKNMAPEVREYVRHIYKSEPEEHIRRMRCERNNASEFQVREANLNQQMRFVISCPHPKGMYGYCSICEGVE